MSNSRFLLIRDIERCPYVPKDPKYAEWNRKNDERIAIILKGQPAK